MYRVRVITVLIALGVSGALLNWGCSDDKSVTSTSVFPEGNIAAFDALISSVAPPPFEATSPLLSPMAVSSADTGYGFWALGQNPLLGKVFGDTEPTALYRNMRRLGETVEWMHRIRRVGDTTFTGVQTENGLCSGTMSVRRLSGQDSSVGIPVACQAALGETPVRMRYQVEVRLNEQTQARLRAGFRRDDSCDLMLAFRGDPDPDSVHPNAYEYSLVYAYHNRIRDSFQVRSVHFRSYGDSSGLCNMWTYQVNSVNGDGFFFRQSWFDDDFADSNGARCVIGSGNRRSEFAFRYQQFVPPDRPEPDPVDPYGHLHRVFGIDYADRGAELTADWNQATDTAKMYRYQHLPVALRTDLSTVHSAMDPWPEE